MFNNVDIYNDNTRYSTCRKSEPCVRFELMSEHYTNTPNKKHDELPKRLQEYHNEMNAKKKRNEPYDTNGTYKILQEYHGSGFYYVSHNQNYDPNMIIIIYHDNRDWEKIESILNEHLCVAHELVLYGEKEKNPGHTHYIVTPGFNSSLSFTSWVEQMFTKTITVTSIF